MESPWLLKPWTRLTPLLPSHRAESEDRLSFHLIASRAVANSTPNRSRHRLTMVRTCHMVNHGDDEELPAPFMSLCLFVATMMLLRRLRGHSCMQPMPRFHSHLTQPSTQPTHQPTVSNQPTRPLPPAPSDIRPASMRAAHGGPATDGLHLDAIKLPSRRATWPIGSSWWLKGRATMVAAAGSSNSYGYNHKVITDA